MLKLIIVLASVLYASGEWEFGWVPRQIVDLVSEQQNIESSIAKLGHFEETEQRVLGHGEDLKNFENTVESIFQHVETSTTQRVSQKMKMVTRTIENEVAVESDDISGCRQMANLPALREQFHSIKGKIHECLSKKKDLVISLILPVKHIYNDALNRFIELKAKSDDCIHKNFDRSFATAESCVAKVNQEANSVADELTANLHQKIDVSSHLSRNGVQSIVPRCHFRHELQHIFDELSSVSERFKICAQQKNEQ